LLPDPHARYDLPALARRTGLPMATLAEQLWQLAWQGQIATAGMQAVRQAALQDFQMPDAAHPLARQRLTRGLQSGKLWPDAWLRLPEAPAETDPMERAERDQERVRQLLDRHGVLFREVLVAEPPLLQWRRLLPAMRVMELSGELLAGHFFAGVPGLQFTTPAMLRRLQAPLPDAAVWWHHAQDPVSCCGIALDELKAPLPARMTGTHLVWHGARLVIVSRRSGAALAMHAPPDDPDLAAALECLVELATRAVQPVRPLRVETVDGASAASSPYRDVLKNAGFIADFKAMLLDRR
jgi:ATP-dependent Lhr-like helicase